MLVDENHVRDPYKVYYDWFSNDDIKRLRRKSEDAEAFFRRIGITFNVYGQDEADERLIPFDIVPRIISAQEWARLERGIEQRVRAINAFLHDIYHRQEILRAGRIPKELISGNEAFLPEMIGVNPPGGVYTHIVGVDLVRTGPDEFFVLEDNCRTPSGVSYMLENRETMLQMFPELFTKLKVRPVSAYPQLLRRSLSDTAPTTSLNNKPVVAVLTPGIHNSAYFEHAFLADQMGAELVESHDLRIENGRVAMRTTQGYQSIDVLYRRVDDEYLDPLTFNPDSLLGVPGIMDVYRAGNITLANAPGTGIADDKALYSYMPDIVEFYTGEQAILKNVPTWRCSEADSLSYVLENLKELVVKEVHGSGGYGMLVGPAASKRELAAFETKLRANPANYIAQPTLALSTVPILSKAGLAPRHVDLRPFVLVSPNRIDITPGGLTRVALKKGSLVVNSSQGGGTKDTWVLGD
ncbi:circularly permuted type 2 ATP-grasp protein [Shimia thalassica]|nr:circularly permuted type 2 ATP-grasp protein [Shimia thalassica]MBU2943230.1 circularly permuted type 2 ATP-grasp protein [Shimia thalassica]MDO6478969.1 circularly permuted type 2 ATP-grasp protein [Shimia thalassica]MDO6484309.1 circularly permuted type 2 ATP-grasp protein [Shimia thalassica]MDO6501299.1 circularly permuted type 2 ATP-grasp protein [Shimia thalassica]MDO6522062.1 circularly permuted type 2 ATP-grasp protein [Shimia thalassica]